MKSVYFPLLIAALALLTNSCGSVKKVAGGVGNVADKARFWKDKDGASADDYTLAGAQDPATEQQLVEAANQAAANAQGVVSEAPDRIDLNDSRYLEEPGDFTPPSSQQPVASVPANADQFASAPSYSVNSRISPNETSPTPPPSAPSNPAPGNPAPTITNPPPVIPPANSGSPGIPTPRESEKEGYIRLLPEPRFPSGEDIVPPGS